MRNRRKYGFKTFVWDVFMCFMTSGLWLIYIYCREQRLKSA